MSELKPCPCPICGAELKIYGPEDWHPTFYDPDSGGDPYNAVCDCGFQFSNGSCNYAEFVAALNRRAQPANEPLTMEELREMDGEPVYIKYHSCGRWEIYQRFMHDHGLYGKTWLAYRRPPERSENG